METWDPISVDTKLAHLLQATLYIDGHYSFVGTPANNTQQLSWPRVGQDAQGRVLNNIPFRVTFACIELAYANALYGLDTPQTANHFIKTSTQKVDVIEKTLTFRDDSPAGYVYPKIDSLLKDYLINSSMCQIKVYAL